MQTFRKTFVIALSLLALPAAGWSLEVFYPADGTYVYESDYLIIKGGESPMLEGMTIEINGVESDLLDVSSPDYRAAFRDLLILQPVWDPGKNVIQVVGFVRGEPVARTTAEIFYLDSLDEQPPEAYRPFVMHLPEKEAQCAGCHVMDPTEEQLHSGDPQKHPCGSCHARMLSKSHVHGPAGVYECVYCHDPDSRPAKYEPRERNADLCNECHFDKVEQFQENEYVHGPVGVGLCSICHDVHASDYPAQLREFTNDLCLRCHADIADETHVTSGVSGKRHPLRDHLDPSRPGRELTCASCHDAHGGDSPSLFVAGVSSRFALCQQCHKK